MMVYVLFVEDEVLIKVKYNDVMKFMIVILSEEKYLMLRLLVMMVFVKIAVRESSE